MDCIAVDQTRVVEKATETKRGGVDLALRSLWAKGRGRGRRSAQERLQTCRWRPRVRTFTIRVRERGAKARCKKTGKATVDNVGTVALGVAR